MKVEKAESKLDYDYFSDSIIAEFKTAIAEDELLNRWVVNLFLDK